MKRLLIGVPAVLLAILIAAHAFQFGAPLSAADKAKCGLSVAVTEGPFFVSGTAALDGAELNTSNLPGVTIAISGHVYEGAEGAKPLPNAKIEIWHTDSAGSYHPNGNGAVTKYKAQDVALRGFVISDAKGAYRFTTIYPGEYTGRTRHIHFKITAGNKVLTTQLIIPSKSGDALTFDDDTIAQGLPSCALLKFDEAAKPPAAKFDFRL